MKLKIKILSIVFFNIFIGVMHASFQKYRDIEFADKARTDIEWNFEIQNKFPGPIKVHIESYDGSLKISKILNNFAPQRKLRIAQVNVKDNFNITITEVGKDKSAESVVFISSNNERRTIYLTLAKDKQGNIDVYPQRGTFMGISGKTDSGLLLDKSKNVQKGEINLTKYAKN